MKTRTKQTWSCFGHQPQKFPGWLCRRIWSLDTAVAMLFRLSVVALAAGITTVYAHNWMHGRSRVPKLSTAVPAPARPSIWSPHMEVCVANAKLFHDDGSLQVGPDQVFGLGWTTGHAGRGDYYFAVLHQEDETKMRAYNRHTLMDYLVDGFNRNLPHFSDPDTNFYGTQDHRISGTPDKSADIWQRMHVSCSNNRMLPGGGKGANAGCRQSIGRGPESYNRGNFYQRKLLPGDPLYFDISNSTMMMQSGVNIGGPTHFKYHEGHLKKDLRAAYFNPKYPYLEAVHKFQVSRHAHGDACPSCSPCDSCELKLRCACLPRQINKKWVFEWDIARFSIPCRKGPGA